MKTSLKWIKALVPGLDVSAKEYTDAMILSGSKVEFYTAMDADLDKIVVGRVEKIEKHPDADKLVICQVNVKTETIQIVTGAPNVFEGAVVPVVLDGGRVAGGHDGTRTPGGIKIKKGKLRGVPSYGMMCSIEELGQTREMFPEAPEDGLYIFPENTEIGISAAEALGLDDTVVDYEITSNRVDCFSILGIAREAAATFHKEFVPPVVTETGNHEDVSKMISVQVEASDLCTRYTARAVKNLHIAPSPAWMQQRLRSQGIRPINNLVDITNYVMMEYGQPMHAYDLDAIEDKKIIVRRAENNSTFVTLDGQKRNVDSDVLMICDGKKPIGIAGIMGGENSMITDDVKTMLFEAATFDGTNIRLSSKKIGLRTDASSIFEKGLDPNNAILAMNRACQLVEELKAGEVIGGVIDIYPEKKEKIRIPFEPEKYNALLGTAIDEKTMLSYFERLELQYDEKTRELIIPTWRQDLLCSADIAEEVARMYGYAKIPTTLPSGAATAGRMSEKLEIEKIAREVALFCGFSQGMTYSFESPKVFDKLMMKKEDVCRKAIVISNPLGEDYSILRTTPLNGMLTSLGTNYSRRNKDVRLFEMGNIYLPKELPLKELPDERMQLTLGMYGEGDFFTMKGVVEELLTRVGMLDRIKYDPQSELTYLHPGRQANIVYDDEIIGYLGEVHPTVAENYGMKDRVYVAVVDMKHVNEKADFERKYEGIANFPASTRDISMVVPKNVLVGDIETVFEEKGGTHLESYDLFDLYEGSQITAGFKSVAYKLTFRAKDRNLEEEDVNKAMDRILKGLDALKIKLRA